MSIPTLLPGVDRHGDGWRVRVSFAGERYQETGITTADAANARVLALKELRAAGLRPDTAPEDPALREVAAALLKSKATHVSRKTGRPLRPRTLEWWTRIVEPCRTGTFAETRLSQLRRQPLEDELLDYSLEHPSEADNRLSGLKAVLRSARNRGLVFDHSIFDIEPIPHTLRERRALAAAELAYLTARAPEHGRRLLTFAGTVGNRWRELATWTDERFDSEAREMFVPAGLCKEGVDKTIDLTPGETRLALESQMARARGSRFVFPTASGLTWDGRYPDWHRDVWTKTVTRAAADWREEHALDEDESTPFEWRLTDDVGEPLRDSAGALVLGRLQPHDLRATAITLMRDAGLTREQTAARVGHADVQLIDKIYDRGDKRRRSGVREALDGLGDGLLVAVGQ